MSCEHSGMNSVCTLLTGRTLAVFIIVAAGVLCLPLCPPAAGDAGEPIVPTSRRSGSASRVSLETPWSPNILDYTDGTLSGRPALGSSGSERWINCSRRTRPTGENILRSNRFFRNS